MTNNMISSDQPTITLDGIQDLARKLGFQQCHISDANTDAHHHYVEQWLAEGLHGEMEWMQRNLELRKNASLILDNTRSVISVRMDYLPESANIKATLSQPEKAYISRYSLGRDYHKLMRNRLAKLAKALQATQGGTYRALVDSAPVLERYFAQKSGMGWIGKNTMLINSKAGSWFFLGEIYTDQQLPQHNTGTSNHCGSCSACLDICPTQAFINPYKLDARKCISYLTIELKGAIPEELRPMMGNRVFGCDDCQLICPWNKFAKPTQETDFSPRHQLDNSDLSQLFLWDEDRFLNNTAGSPIRRIGHERWLRNLSVGLGNAPRTETIISALKQRLNHPSALVKEHVHWALIQHSAH